jgi:DNA polymerase elongation subunit (family B)
MGSETLSVRFLLDVAATETNAVKLKFLKQDGEIQEITDNTYKPYFLAAHPLTTQDKQTVEYFSAEVQEIEKIDLFTNEKRRMSKLSWPNLRIASQAAQKFGQCWEKDIQYSNSYVYDRGLIFGAPYPKDELKPILDVPSPLNERLESTFGEVQHEDRPKYSQIAYWFSLLNQSIPNTNTQLFGTDKADPESVYAAWMLSRIANLPLSETFNSHRVSDWLKSIMYTYLRKNNFLIPTANELTKGYPVHTVTGALTVAPKAGTYFNTAVCDFESLYPSCIDSFNLSYETVNCGHPECMSNRIPDFDGHVCTRQRGFYAILVGALKELRIRLFKLMSKDNALTEEQRRIAVAEAKLLKLILVSSYGVTVRIHGLACPPLAEAITGYGRYVLKESWQTAEEHGMRPLYGDTDSLFLDNASEEQVNWLIKTVKERFSLDLALDKRYSLCVLPKAKKAYFGILSDGSPDIKGVTATKSNSPGYITKVFQQCVKELANVRNQDEYERARNKIAELIHRGIADLRNGRVELEDLVYSVQLFFDPNKKMTDVKTTAQPYQCARQLIDIGRKLKKGDTMSFIKVKPFKYRERTFTVKPAEIVRNIAEVNADDYVRNLQTALGQTFEPMGIKLEKAKLTSISDWVKP